MKHYSKQVQLVLFLLSVSILCKNQFKTSPDVRISFTSPPTSVRISPNDNRVAVGLTNSTINVYSLKNYSLLQTLNGCHSSSYSIKDIKEVSGNGWVSLDTNNTACKWSLKGNNQIRWQFNKTVIDMSTSFQTDEYAIVGFNFGDQIYQYHSQTNSTIPRYIYNASAGKNFTRIQYTAYGTSFYYATSDNNVYQNQCQKFRPDYRGQTNSTVTYFSRVNISSILFTDTFYLYKTDYYTYFTQMPLDGVYDTIVGSYNNEIYNNEILYIAMKSNSDAALKVFDSKGNKMQELDYAYAYYRSIDASSKYLVYADSSGYMGIATYKDDTPTPTPTPTPDDNSFPIWAFIVIGVGFLLICIVVIICCVVKAKKRRLAMAANGYNRFNDTKGTNTILPNSQLG